MALRQGQEALTSVAAGTLRRGDPSGTAEHFR